MAQQTALNWLKDKLKETYDKEGKLPLAYTLHLVEQALQKEKEQMIDCYLKADLFPRLYEFEKYYNETYGGQGTPDTISPNK